METQICPVLAIFQCRCGIHPSPAKRRSRARDESTDLPTMYNTEIVPKKARLLERIEDWEDGQ